MDHLSFFLGGDISRSFFCGENSWLHIDPDPLDWMISRSRSRALEHRNSGASQFPSKKTPSKPPMVATRISKSLFCFVGGDVRWVLFSPCFLVALLSCVSYLLVCCGEWIGDELVVGSQKRGVCFRGSWVLLDHDSSDPWGENEMKVWGYIYIYIYIFIYIAHIFSTR